MWIRTHPSIAGDYQTPAHIQFGISTHFNEQLLHPFLYNGSSKTSSMPQTCDASTSAKPNISILKPRQSVAGNLSHQNLAAAYHKRWFQSSNHNLISIPPFYSLSSLHVFWASCSCSWAIHARYICWRKYNFGFISYANSALLISFSI